MSSRPIIAIVGRPNVGKSTLFNRLTKRRRAIVEDTPGVTRDRHYADVPMRGKLVTVVDTGGFVPDSKEDPLARFVRLQAQAAVEECEVVIFVCDGRVGVSSGDQEVATFLRKQKKPVLLLINKCDDHKTTDTLTAEFSRLGLGEAFGVSAEHNEGIEAVLDAVMSKIPDAPDAPEDQGGRRNPVALTPEEGEEVELTPAPERPMKVAIVGRPNVGKSTLVNALLGKDRVIVSPVAGTTRDPIDSAMTWKGTPITLTDTAGIRRKAVISQKVEQFSVLGAMRAVEDSDVAVLVLDATEPAVEQDLKIAALAQEKGRALIICVNKWDLVKGQVSSNGSVAREETFRDTVKWYMKWVSWAPMVFISAKEGAKVGKVLDLALQLFEQQYFRAGTPLLNRIIEHVTSEHPLPQIERGRQLRLYYAAQVGTAPPAFTIMCNAPTSVPERFERYVINYLRETFRLKVPIRVFWRERPGQKKRAERAQQFKAREKSKRLKR
jgi:GTP-binding protein